MKKLIPYISFLIIFYLFYYFLSSNNKSLDNQLKMLKEENKILSKKNDSIYNVIGNLEELKAESDKKISSFQKEGDELKSKIDKVTVQLNNFKNKYEKAIHHSDNFSSSDIQSYFTDSIR